MGKITNFFQMIAGGIETGSTFALAALGLALIYQTSRIVNFAQGTLGMFNGYICAYFLAKTIPSVFPGIPGWAALLLAIFGAFIVSMVLGVLVDIIIMSRAYKVSHTSKQIITLAVIIVFVGLTPMFFNTQPQPFPRLLSAQTLKIGGVAIEPNAILIVVIALAIMLLMFWFLQYTRWGLAVRVTASNPVTARLMGIPVSMVNHGSWAIAGVCGALAAIIIAPKMNISMTMMDNVHLNSFIAAIFGGFDTFYGPMVGAYIIAILNNIMLFYISTKWAPVLLYGFILLFIVVRPSGLFGKKSIKKV